MEKIRYGKWAGWIALSLYFLIVNVVAQQGFLSLNCGGKTNTTAQNGITWISDANYIDVGNTADIEVIAFQLAYGSYLNTLRFFPKPLNKSCYQLPVDPGVPYLLRLWFTLGNYTGFQQWPSFNFSIETLGLLTFQHALFKDTGVYDYEYVLVSSGNVLYICLIRTSDTDDPFINAIELRALREGMYAAAKPGTILTLSSRVSVGGNFRAIRYPQDNFDRIWIPQSRSTNKNLAVAVSTRHLISSNNTDDFPPSAVMQTAWVINSSESNGILFFSGPPKGKKQLMVLYFAEIQTLNQSESRSFYVQINGKIRPDMITLVQTYSALEFTFISNNYSTDNSTFELFKATETTQPPIINAYEYYLLSDTQPATYSQDVEALNAIKNKFDMKNWISDPCYLIKWEGIGCDDSSPVLRISKIDLSERNLTGSVPENIGQLTGLVIVSLHNNHLSGPLPNFSSLTMLEKLYLQNNKLSGSLPYWLSQLTNLKELFIENNNFSGVIPAQLLQNSLKLTYFGNPYLLSLPPRQDIIPESKNSKVGMVLGITLSGILIIALAFIMGIVVYQKKFRRKKVWISVTGREHLVDPDYSMIVVPNPVKSRAFTVDDMMAATQNFSKKIGRGGFGWVFFGQLPEGKDIAVKVLSLFSKQGVSEFLNEVDLLSRIHHRNLVSFLGYCNETRELMLIYEYMSGGSLKDHLYGDSAGCFQLDWKKRVKIALDAAEGLEYLHVGCTPKIIHRDVKTANILLDSNWNGKLADFGLSRMTVDGEATHVTTAVKGTAGYLDPEYFITQNLTDKSDVYSFGVVLFEIICGRKPIDVNLPEEEVNLIRWVTPYVEMDGNPGKIAEIIDRRLGNNNDMKSMSHVAKVAIRCVQAEPSCRPSMTEVVGELREAAKDDDAPEDIGIQCSVLESSGPSGMEWGDISSNIFNTGR